MGPMTLTTRRQALALLGVGALALSLTACYQEVKASDLPSYTVFQNSRDVFGPLTFSYLDSAGEKLELICPAVGLFERRYCDSEDGLVHMEYSTSKQGVRLRLLTVDGAERDIVRISTDYPGVNRAWAPTGGVPHE